MSVTNVDSPDHVDHDEMRNLLNSLVNQHANGKPNGTYEITLMLQRKFGKVLGPSLEQIMLAGETFVSHEQDKAQFYKVCAILARDCSQNYNFVPCVLEVLERRSLTWKEGEKSENDWRLFECLRAYYFKIGSLDPAFKGVDLLRKYATTCLKSHADKEIKYEQETLVTLLEHYARELAKLPIDSFQRQTFLDFLKFLIKSVPSKQIVGNSVIYASVGILREVYKSSFVKNRVFFVDFGELQFRYYSDCVHVCGNDGTWII
jgi:hypothetical protein